MTTPAPLKPNLRDIEVPMTVIVGTVTLTLDDIANWNPDSVVALSAQASDPLTISVGGKVIATGELCEGTDGPGSLAIRILDIIEDTDAA